MRPLFGAEKRFSGAESQQLELAQELWRKNRGQHLNYQSLQAHNFRAAKILFFRCQQSFALTDFLYDVVRRHGIRLGLKIQHQAVA